MKKLAPFFAMSLFQQSVLKKYLNDLDKDYLQQLWTVFASHFHNPTIQQNILNAKEEEYQEGFVRDLFVKVFGYTLNPQPDYNFVLEKKTEADSTKSDGAILQAGKVVGIIELKDTATTDLDKVEKQAFGYKHRHRECIYVITANFQKLRFYINDAIEYEEFDLFNLTQERFALLYLCLSEQTIFKNIPLLIKKASLTQEEAVTKTLYADYSGFRKKLFHNIIELNPQYPKIELFQKTQKLLDRFLFILFAEDRLLVPPNSVREILKQWQQLKEMDAEVPLYERFRKYFGYLNTGHQGKQFEIFAYNGGLFATDEMLDHIKIDDAILYDSCMALSNYDFQTEVDVNILGHIFEHSLNEIEELQAEAAGNAIDKSKTRRKKEGIFYTPRYITKYIVANTVGALCDQKKEELSINEEVFAYRKRKDKKRERLVKLLDDYRNWLLQLTICDPACGSGAFLNQALEYLIAEHRYIDELKANLFGDAFVLTDLDNEILEHNLYGIDINEEATEIARLSLWLRTAKKDRKLSSLNNHIQCGNSLIDDPAVAGDKAFNWQKVFPNIFEQGGFDVVIGNPPYGASFNQAEKDFISNYKTYKYKFESYVYFFERGISILKQGGFLGYITPELWLNLENCEPLRTFIFNNSDLVEINVIGENVFSDAVVNTIITILCKEKKKKAFSIVNKEMRWDYPYDSWMQSRLLAIEYRVNARSQKIIEKIESSSKKLIEYGEVIQGITPYDKYRGQDPELIKNRGYHFTYKKDETCGKWLSGEDINRYSLLWSGEWLSYGEWLAAPREKKFFEGNRLLFREIPGKSRRIQAVLASETSFYGHSITPFILFDRNDENTLKKILCLVNSTLISWYGNLKLSNFGKEVFPKLNPQDIKLLPIHNELDKSKLPFIAKADIMLSKNKELREVTKQLLQLLQSNFPEMQLSKKLEQWPSLSFAELLKELRKQKIKPTLPQQSEWMKYFEEQKTVANSIQKVIDTTDKEIDRMVYQLYGLTEDEIEIVEAK